MRSNLSPNPTKSADSQMQMHMPDEDLIDFDVLDQDEVNEVKRLIERIQHMFTNGYADERHVPGQMIQEREDQVMNRAGGYVFQISNEDAVRRFMIIGTFGGTYYASEREITAEAIQTLVRIIRAGEGLMIVKQAIDISVNGRAPKHQPLIFALALCARYHVRDTTRKVDSAAAAQLETIGGDMQELMATEYQHLLQKIALYAVHKVCRTPTHLFMFIKYCRKVSSETGLKKRSIGWGRALRATVTKWYYNRLPERLIMQVTKYRFRESYSHRDLFRLSHIHPKTSFQPTHNYWKHHIEYDAIFKYIATETKTNRKKRRQRGPAAQLVRVARNRALEREVARLALAPRVDAPGAPRRGRRSENAPDAQNSYALKYLSGFRELQRQTEEPRAIQLISEFGFVHEQVPTMLLKSAEIWRALLPRMPMTAMLRSLSRMSMIGLLSAENISQVQFVVDKLRNAQLLHDARVHPLAVLTAKIAYSRESEFKRPYDPLPAISDALEYAFKESFNNVAPTGKRFCIGLDVSGSMSSNLSGTRLSCREAASAMGMILYHTEPDVDVLAFSDHLMPLNWTREMSLNEILDKTDRLPFGNTDCALPMITAKEAGKIYDVFMILTDNETQYGDVHPYIALKEYREYFQKPDVKLIVIAMTASNFTIADPRDPHMLDVCGFDTSVPEIIREFVLGKI